MLNARNIFILILIIAAATLRVLGILPYNFTPVAAMALFGGAMFSNRVLAFVLPLAVMLISDVFIGFHNSLFAVYAAFILIVLIGRVIFTDPSMLKAIGGALVGSVLFFFITNASAWWVLPEYTKDLSGLISSYIAGLPFFRGTLVGDILFTAVFFGSFKLAEIRFPQLVRA
ncbi:MAG: hypothetical protein H6602_11330 [Flavobacteriales bacterium]|nr:hypothetical protein [Flavobacteriales bacterium]